MHACRLQTSCLGCSHPALTHHYSYSPSWLTASVTGSVVATYLTIPSHGRGACTGSIWYVLVGGLQPLTIHTPSSACNSHGCGLVLKNEIPAFHFHTSTAGEIQRVVLPGLRNTRWHHTPRKLHRRRDSTNTQIDWKNLIGYLGRLKPLRMSEENWLA